MAITAGGKPSSYGVPPWWKPPWLGPRIHPSTPGPNRMRDHWKPRRLSKRQRRTKKRGDFFPPIDIPNPPLRSVFFAKNHRFIVDSSMKTARVGDFLPLKLQSSIGFGYFPSATKQMTENMMVFQATQWCCWHKDIVKPIMKAQVLMANTKPCLVVLGMVDV